MWPVDYARFPQTYGDCHRQLHQLSGWLWFSHLQKCPFVISVQVWKNTFILIDSANISATATEGTWTSTLFVTWVKPLWPRGAQVLSQHMRAFLQTPATWTVFRGPRGSSIPMTWQGRSWSLCLHRSFSILWFDIYLFFREIRPTMP